MQEGSSPIYGSFQVPGLLYKTIKDPENIMYIMSQVKNKSLNIYFKSGYVLLVKTRMKYMQDKLDPAYFFRSHKLFLVNLNFVAAYWYNRRCLVLRLSNVISSEVVLAPKIIRHDYR